MKIDDVPWGCQHCGRYYSNQNFVTQNHIMWTLRFSLETLNEGLEDTFCTESFKPENIVEIDVVFWRWHSMTGLSGWGSANNSWALFQRFYLNISNKSQKGNKSMKKSMEKGDNAEVLILHCCKYKFRRNVQRGGVKNELSQPKKEKKGHFPSVRRGPG